MAAAGLVLLIRIDANVNYLTDLLPALMLFSLGLSMTVAPLTATVLADADERNAGIASGVNNAIARVSALVTIAAVGAVVAAHFGSKLDGELGPLGSRPEVARAAKEAKQQPLAVVKVKGVPPAVARRVERSARDASVSAFRLGMAISALLVALGGVLGLVGIRNPRREVSSEECAGGQLAGAPSEAARQSPCDWHREPVAQGSAARPAAAPSG